MEVNFFTGCHHPADARHFERAFVSVNTIRDRKGPFVVGEWVMDSGAFMELYKYGHYRHSVEHYAEQIKRWSGNGELVAAVTQDYMCEPFILAKTGLTIADHQRLTIERYDALLACDTGVYIMPVLQGYDPDDYAAHVRAYGSRLTLGAWVGVGSVCKRNRNISAIEDVLLAIHHERPDLRLHGFGIKSTALSSGLVQHLLHSADSMAWSFAARIEGRNGNDHREALRWVKRIETRPIQWPLFVP